MTNGNGQANGAPMMPPGTIQVNSGQAATFALQFIQDVPHTRMQREAYDVAVMFLQAIARGDVVLVAKDAPAPQVMADTPAAPVPE